MATLRTIAIHWYRKVFGAPPGSDIREEGLATVLDGNSAVALSEARARRLRAPGPKDVWVVGAGGTILHLGG